MVSLGAACSNCPAGNWEVPETRGTLKPSHIYSEEEEDHEMYLSTLQVPGHGPSTSCQAGSGCMSMTHRPGQPGESCSPWA